MLRLTIIVVLLLPAPLAFAQGTVIVEPVDQSGGATTLYRLQFSLPDSLNNSGVISVTFPSEFDLSGVNIVASTLIKGGLQAQVHGSTVLAVRKGLGDLMPAGTRVDLLFSAVKNPAESAGPRILKVSLHKTLADFLTKTGNGVFEPTDSALQGSVGIGQAN